MRLIVFGGTSEGRRLAERLVDLPVEATLCVATDAGREALAGLTPRFAVLVGRMDGEDMLRLLERGGYDAVIDATHPYAVAVSGNARAAAEDARIPYFRLARAASPGCAHARYPSVAAAAAALAAAGGNILAATGSKDLAAYTAVPDYARRLYPRVFPSVEAIRRCESLGIPLSHVIAMRGPFGLELNRALMTQFAIRVLVTKDGGAAGGFPEKMRAAAELGVETLVVERPPESGGLGLEDVLERIRGCLEGGFSGKSDQLPPDFPENC